MKKIIVLGILLIFVYPVFATEYWEQFETSDNSGITITHDEMNILNLNGLSLESIQGDIAMKRASGMSDTDINSSYTNLINELKKENIKQKEKQVFSYKLSRFVRNYDKLIFCSIIFVVAILVMLIKRDYIFNFIKTCPKDNYYLLAYITLIYLLLLTLYCLLSYEITNSKMGMFQIAAWGVSVFSFWSSYREFNNNKNSKWLLPLVFFGILYNQIFKIRFEDWNIINLVTFAILTTYLILNIKKTNNKN